MHWLVSRLENEVGITSTATAAVPSQREKQHIRFVRLWQQPLARRTLILWLVWLGIVFSYYGIFTWLPKLLVEQGSTMVKTLEYVLAMIVAQLPGYIVTATLVEKIGCRAALVGSLVARAACAWFFGQSGSTAEVMTWGSLMSLSNPDAWGVLYTYAPGLYPLRSRASASGWTDAIGRIDDILAPMVIIKMVGSSGGFGDIFMMSAGVMTLIVLVILALDEETKGRTLGEINS